MVQLLVKRGDEDQFLFETTVDQSIEKLMFDIVAIFNGRLKISRICSEIDELSEHGPMLPQEMIGLTDEQIQELKLTDAWADKCIPSGGYEFNKDPIGRRNGRAPKANMKEVLKKAKEDVKKMIDKKLARNNTALTLKVVDEALNILKGAIMIVYPMQLPPHDPIRMEFANMEDLSGSQAALEVIEPAKAQLWFAGRQMLPEKKIFDYAGKNEKCKIVIKLTKHKEGPPGREPVLTEEVRRRLMADAYRRQEQLKKLEQDDDDQYLNSNWADGGSLKRQVHGIEDVKFRIGM